MRNIDSFIVTPPRSCSSRRHRRAGVEADAQARRLAAGRYARCNAHPTGRAASGVGRSGRRPRERFEGAGRCAPFLGAALVLAGQPFGQGRRSTGEGLLLPRIVRRPLPLDFLKRAGGRTFKTYKTPRFRVLMVL